METAIDGQRWQFFGSEKRNCNECRLRAAVQARQLLVDPGLFLGGENTVTADARGHGRCHDIM